MRIDYAAPKDIPALTRLWQDCFGDSEAFIRLFFDTAYAPERCRCVFEEDTPAAALYWFDVYCRGQKMAYIYAVATDPAHRGKGFCRALMADTHAVLTREGYRAAMLVPEGEALRRMYAGFGYEPGTTAVEVTCVAGGDPVAFRTIGREEFALRRRRMLPAGGVIQEGENLLYLEHQTAFVAGEGFLAAVHLKGEEAFFQELLGDAAKLPGLLAALGAKRATARCPGNGKEFAMFLPLDPGAEKPGYFAFAFD